MSGCIFRPSDFVAFQKDTLRNTTVFNSLLNDVKGIIFQVVEDSAFADSVVFIRIFNDWLLEVSLELKDLYLRISKSPCL